MPGFQIAEMAWQFGDYGDDIDRVWQTMCSELSLKPQQCSKKVHWMLLLRLDAAVQHFTVQTIPSKSFFRPHSSKSQSDLWDCALFRVVIPLYHSIQITEVRCLQAGVYEMFDAWSFGPKFNSEFACPITETTFIPTFHAILCSNTRSWSNTFQGIIPAI